MTVLAQYPITKINDETFLNSFIADQIAAAKAGFYDGINFDVESPITTEKDALALTHVMNATNVAMKAALGPDFQVTADLAWSPDCIDRRCYDYTGIGKAVDKVFIMSYDLRYACNAPLCARRRVCFMACTLPRGPPLALPSLPVLQLASVATSCLCGRLQRCAGVG
ncbi:MAG: hypothetical protein EOO65_02970 [Methanosarcinales archaeon]|nr:MAG: hypothetical protein EOO65_02970 [Methanosarcinales archaeon]